ncbi:MAG: DUF6119 family protein [Minwuia sp.]|uniref:DUF6119 family protein n=1 Tax=Minwuia sp. TaxID=2493630 RepID=UPI003A854580
MPNKSFTLYLTTPETALLSDVLSETALNQLESGIGNRHEIQDFGDRSELFIFTGPPKIPDWLKNVHNTFGIRVDLTTRSAAGLLAFEASGRIFVSSFSYGWMYLNDDVVVGDFGLRVAINTLDDTKLKELDRSNLGSAMQDSAKSPFRRSFDNFGFDEALDHIKRVSGKAQENLEEDAVSGAKSLKFSGDFALTDLPEIAERALTAFGSHRYRSTSFQVIDLVQPVPDPLIQKNLDEILVDHVIGGTENFELGLPAEYLDDSVSYKFSGIGERGAFPDLVIENYRRGLGDRLTDLNLQDLKKHRIHSVSFEGNRPIQAWSIYKSIVGSVSFLGGLYSINEGQWFRVDAQFRQSVDSHFEDIVDEEWTPYPGPFVRFYETGRAKGTYEREEEFNQRVSAQLGYICMDRILVPVPEAVNSRFELCDILDIANKRLIHVKKSSRKSTILSHFFKQGSNSAQFCRTSPAIWEHVTNSIRERNGLDAAAQMEDAVRSTENRWTIEFWIADTPRENGSFNIPFFSKVSLREEARRMRAMDYNVRLRFITLPAPA